MLKVTADGGSPPQLSGGRRGGRSCTAMELDFVQLLI